MKNLLAVTVLAAALLCVSTASAQTYSIDWHTIAGGGGTSSGTNGTNIYSVSGTVGQPATATMSGGNYSLTGGFWSIISVVQTAGAPVLTITRSGNQATISWSATAANYVLEQSGTLMQNSWSLSGATSMTNNGTISVMVTATGGYQYFRLHASQ